MFAQPFRAQWSLGIRLFNQDRGNGRHVANGGDQIVVQVLGLAGQVFFHQGKAQTLSDAPFNLPFGKLRIDRAAHVMGGDNVADAGGAQFHVDLYLGQLRAVAVLRVRRPLTIGIQCGGRRVIGFFDANDVAMRVFRKVLQRDSAALIAVRDRQCAICRDDLIGIAQIGLAQDRGLERSACRQCGAAGDKGLAGCGCLATIRRAAGVRTDQFNRVNRHAKGICGYLRDHGVRTLPDICRPLVQHHAPLCGDAKTDR